MLGRKTGINFFLEGMGKGGGGGDGRGLGRTVK